jgi:ATP-dependent Lhr-like helicase
VAARLAIGSADVEAALRRLAASGRVLAGEFRPGGRGREWCDREVLATIRQRSLARLRKDVAPVDPAALGRFLLAWHGVGRPRGGLDALLDIVEQLQAMPLPASVLEREMLPARTAGYQPADLDALIAAGEVTWLGVEPLGERDGRVALYLTDHLPRLAPPADGSGGLDRREAAIVQHLGAQGASFFASLHDAAGGGFPQETVDALWSLVWKGLLTNDTLQPLRALITPPDRSRGAVRRSGFRSRRLVPPTAEGRWSLVGVVNRPAPTEWAAAMAAQLLTRHGIVTREAATLESLPGGFALVYQVLRRMEETGRIRRGYFVAGLGGAQFAQPAAVDLLRSKGEETGAPLAVMLAATDPANPYGSLLPWPAWPGAGSRGASRSAGARVVLVGGWPVAWIARGDRQMLVMLPEEEPDRSRTGRALAAAMVAAAIRMPEGQQGWLVEGINGAAAAAAAESIYLIDAGFAATGLGLQLRVPRRRAEADSAP